MIWLSGNRAMIPIVVTRAALIPIMVVVSFALAPPLRKISRVEYGSLKSRIGSQVQDQNTDDDVDTAERNKK